MILSRSFLHLSALTALSLLQTSTVYAVAPQIFVQTIAIELASPPLCEHTETSALSESSDFGLLVASLGDDCFEIREAATQRLIALLEQAEQETCDAEGFVRHLNTERFLAESLKVYSQAPIDPEIKSRLNVVAAKQTYSPTFAAWASSEISQFASQNTIPFGQKLLSEDANESAAVTLFVSGNELLDQAREHFPYRPDLFLRIDSFVQPFGFLYYGQFNTLVSPNAYEVSLRHHFNGYDYVLYIPRSGLWDFRITIPLRSSLRILDLVQKDLQVVSVLFGNLTPESLLSAAKPFDFALDPAPEPLDSESPEISVFEVHNGNQAGWVQIRARDFSYSLDVMIKLELQSFYENNYDRTLTTQIPFWS